MPGLFCFLVRKRENQPITTFANIENLILVIYGKDCN